MARDLAVLRSALWGPLLALVSFLFWSKDDYQYIRWLFTPGFNAETIQRVLVDLFLQTRLNKALFLLFSSFFLPIFLSLFFFPSTTVIQNVNKAQVKIRAKKDNVAGKWPALRVPGGVKVTFTANQLHNNILMFQFLLNKNSLMAC